MEGSGHPSRHGRRTDLANAYKQLLLCPFSKKHCATVLPAMGGGKPQVYFTKVLPFEATATIYYFLRFSEMIKLVLLGSLGILTNFYLNDVPTLSFSPQ